MERAEEDLEVLKAQALENAPQALTLIDLQGSVCGIETANREIRLIFSLLFILGYRFKVK